MKFYRYRFMGFRTNSKKTFFLGICIMLVFVGLLVLLSQCIEQDYITSVEDDGPPSVYLDMETFSIDTISDEQIVGVYSKNGGILIGETHSGRRSGIDSVRYGEWDYDYNNFRAGQSVTGVATVSSTKLTDCSLKLKISSTVESGKMKIVIIKDTEIIEYVDINEAVELVYKVDGTHRFYVKVLCEDAKMDISVERELI